MGTESAYAWATPPKAFSDPGPVCMVKTPIVLPFLIRLKPSAMLTPARSCRERMGRIPSGAGVNKGLRREGRDPLDALVLEYFGYCLISVQFPFSLASVLGCSFSIFLNTCSLWVVTTVSEEQTRSWWTTR